MANRDEVKRMELPLPNELHDLLVERARRNGRTLKAEIIFTLEKSATASRRKPERAVQG
jgi:hypothetical protein